MQPPTFVLALLCPFQFVYVGGLKCCSHIPSEIHLHCCPTKNLRAFFSPRQTTITLTQHCWLALIAPLSAKWKQFLQNVGPKKKHFKLRHHDHPGQLGKKVLAHKLHIEIKFKIIIIINQQAKSSSWVFPVKPKKLGLSQCLIYPFLTIAWQMSPFPELILF